MSKQGVCSQYGGVGELVVSLCVPTHWALHGSADRAAANGLYIIA